MRRSLALIAIPLLACVALAGCGGSSKSTASSSSAASPGANTAVTATGAFGQTPKVTIPKAKADNSLTVKTLIQGTGAILTKSDVLAASYVIYTWDGTTSSEKGSTFGSVPSPLPSKTLPGLETALIGKKVGSRVLAVIPPAQGFGTSGNPQAGVKATTTLVFVVDLVKAYSDPEDTTGTQVSAGGNLPTVSAMSGTAPTLTFPSSSPPGALVTKTLVKGSGPKVAKGDYVVAQYVGYIWRTKQVFSSSWSSGSAFGFTIGASPAQIIPGWDKGLVGQTTGSRVMLSIPPAQGYGRSGQSQAGIKGNDTLVFVVDILTLKQS
jgi:peptidylprolyl isomerase